MGYKLRDTRPLAERFWDKVTIGEPDECWLWSGGIANGYGVIRSSRRGRLLRAHRVSWGLANGRDAGSAHVLHSCDNPPCVNPRHLSIGTHAENMRQAFARGRIRSPAAKLTDAQVQDIMASHSSMSGPLSEWVHAQSEKHGISAKSIRNIIRGLAFKRLCPEARN